MEAIILTCLQAQLMVGRVVKQEIPKEIKNDIIWELKQVTPKNCKIDTNVL